MSEIELAFRFCPSPVIAVTGTNGKSSVVTLLEHVLRAAGRAAVACGNLGVPFSAVVERLNPETIAVVEVSSFQLSWCQTFHPQVGVLLNLGTNHLDRHVHRDDYVRAKARLFQSQTHKDWAVLNGRDPDVAALGERLSAQHVWFGDNRTNPPRFHLATQTQARLSDNAQAVLQVGRVFGIPDPLIWQTIRRFRGLEHRLEHVAAIHGVSFINDSKSTTPESLVFALRQLHGPVVLIIGGRDKGMDFQPLAEAVAQTRVKGAILIGESRHRLRGLLAGATTLRECATLEDAVEAAAALAVPGDTVLFSPACASFDMFPNFEARGQAFKVLVHRLNGAGGVPAPALAKGGPAGHGMREPGWALAQVGG